MMEKVLVVSPYSSTLKRIQVDEGFFSSRVGRVAQAKRAKLVMKTMTLNSPLVYPLWDEALRRWKILSGLVGHRPFDDFPGDAPVQDSVAVSGGLSGEGVQVSFLGLASLFLCNLSATFELQM